VYQIPQKKIKVEFVKTVSVELTELVKDLNLDEIIRVLPSGGCKVVQASSADNSVFLHND